MQVPDDKAKAEGSLWSSATGPDATAMVTAPHQEVVTFFKRKKQTQAEVCVVHITVYQGLLLMS